ncbi:MAG TPA: CBS domain-containing protein [Syntrophorhabdaceae bacterium]|nr:CBS domain-containing protein [Syntrophorhabdaceae bacterium]HPA07239.1 CBS domain-containing protein [Methanoregulaceae archaeon]
MKAVHLHEYGPAENLRLVDIPVPEPADNEVLIKVKAASVIFADILMRKGDYPALPASLPFVPGREVAGIVERVGAGVSAIKPGMCGYFIGGLAGFWVPLAPADRIVLSAVGMSTCLGVVVREPLTSLLIVFEMTHQFAVIPALMVGAIISVVISHLATKANFYDAVLLQDGHELIKIRPPLDIMSWHNLPITAIANPHPVVVHDLSKVNLRQMLENHPYHCFPVDLNNGHIGILTRGQIESILRDGVILEIPAAVTCLPEHTVREVGNRFIESPQGCIVVTDGHGGGITGIITLHDLLRAQAAVLD